jgi:phosphohistidine phosphatase
MRRLLLLRHAKSSWDNPGLDDFERPLSERGIRDAPRIGAFMRTHDLTPDQVICSPARRAVETWEAVAPELPEGVSFDFDPELYLASRSTIMDVVRSQPDSVATLMLVGHNPGTEITGRGLSSDGPAEALARLRTKVPTASLIEVQLPVDRWDEVEWGSGTLGYFVTPSWLAKTGL